MDERVKDIVGKEAREEEEETTEQTREQELQQDDEEYDTIRRINLVREGKRVKEFRVTGNLINANIRMIMDNITPHIEMKVKVIYSFKVEIHQGGGKIVDYSKSLTSPPGMCLEEIQAYIEECEQKRLDLENEEVWSKAYLPATRPIETKGNYEGKVIFKHVQLKLVASNEPLMGCEPLPD